MIWNIRQRLQDRGGAARGPRSWGSLGSEKKCKKEYPQNIDSYYYKLLVSTRPPVQAKGGELGQLTCHAPVTFRSVELDFLVGTENPIRLLYGVAPLTPDKGKQGVPDWENSFCRLFSLFWGGNAVEIEAGFTCDWSADWITGGWRGGATLSIDVSRPLIGSSGRLPGGTKRRGLREQG